MVKRHLRTFVVVILVALCLGLLGTDHLYRSRGVPGQMQLLFEAVAELAEKSGEHEEDIGLIVAHIELMKASLCEIHAAETPGFCTTPCVVGICDTQGEGDACEGENPPPACDNSDPDCPGC